MLSIVAGLVCSSVVVVELFSTKECVFCGFLGLNPRADITTHYALCIDIYSILRNDYAIGSNRKVPGSNFFPPSSRNKKKKKPKKVVVSLRKPTTTEQQQG